VRCATASEFFAVSTKEQGRPHDMIFGEQIYPICLTLQYMMILIAFDDGLSLMGPYHV
jgi:hypothetical protein